MELRLQPIGVIHSPLTEASGAPIQPRFAAGVLGRAVLDGHLEPGLADLDGFERIWLLTWMHRASPCALRVTPYLDTREHGVFATRAPSRPNPIALSCVRLLRREGSVLHLTELDLLDGTPVLDIKPYAPRFDAYPGVEAGWLDQADAGRTQADGRFQTPHDV